MDELLPAAFLVGMSNPRTWVEQVGQQMTQQFPDRPLHWRQYRNGLRYLSWQERTSAAETITVWLCAHPTQLYCSVWTSTWDHHREIGYWPYHALLTTLATQIIDQYTDPAGPAIALQIESYATTQAPFTEDE